MRKTLSDERISFRLRASFSRKNDAAGTRSRVGLLDPGPGYVFTGEPLNLPCFRIIETLAAASLRRICQQRYG